MMTDREKLEELLATTYLTKEYGEILATYLVNNGVTVQRWIPVSEMLPEAGVMILVFADGYTDIGWYDGYYDEWRSDITATRNDVEITHWMPLPDLPKDGE